MRRTVYVVKWSNYKGQRFQSLPFETAEAARAFGNKMEREQNLAKFSKYNVRSWDVEEVTHV